DGTGEWKTVKYDSPGATETRGLGIDEMLRAIDEARPHRASGALALHVLETALAVLRSAEDGRIVEIDALEAVGPRGAAVGSLRSASPSSQQPAGGSRPRRLGTTADSR